MLPFVLSVLLIATLNLAHSIHFSNTQGRSLIPVCHMDCEAESQPVVSSISDPLG